MVWCQTFDAMGKRAVIFLSANEKSNVQICQTST